MLILASTSLTRKALMQNAGIAFAARSPGVNEREIELGFERENPEPEIRALRLAEAKARAIDAELVIGADQILSLDGEVLHKSATLDVARARLDTLAGRTHQLDTAVVLVRDGTVIWHHVETARLTMHAFSTAEREAILAAEGETILGSVGAYRLEGPSLRLFEKVEGDYFSILGLPLVALVNALRIHAPSSLEGFT